MPAIHDQAMRPKRQFHLGVNSSSRVRATDDDVKFSPAPRYTFSRGDELCSDNQIRPGNEHFHPKVVVDIYVLYIFYIYVYIFLGVPGPLTTNTPGKWFFISTVGTKYYFTDTFLRAAFESPCDSRDRTLSDIKKKEKLTKIHATTQSGTSQ